MEKAATLSKQQKIPKYLIYEEMDGKPVYYKGYREVLDQNKTLDDIMGCSDLQGTIVSVILEYLYKNIDSNHYRIITNEIGLHLDRKNNLSSDIAIYDKSLLKETPLKNRYFDIPPLAVIEVDTNAEIKDFEHPMSYYHLKTQKLLDFGVQEMVWISTESGKVTVAHQQQDWMIMDWQKPVTLFRKYSFSVVDLLKREGITLPAQERDA